MEGVGLVLLGCLMLLVERVGYHRFGWTTGWHVAVWGCLAVAAGMVSIILQFGG